MLLSIAYFPPIEYFALLAKYSVNSVQSVRDSILSSFSGQQFISVNSVQSVRDSIVWLEACENYQKQSWRNRCRILSANGPLDLNVPVVHENGTFSLPIKRIRVDYSTPWVLRTERAIESAYCSSPFYIYYRDPLFAILDSHPETLWELDRRLIDFFCAKIGIAPDIRETESFVAGIGTAGLSPATSEECRSAHAADTDSCLEEGYGSARDKLAVAKCGQSALAADADSCSEAGVGRVCDESAVAKCGQSALAADTDSCSEEGYGSARDKLAVAKCGQSALAADADSCSEAGVGRVCDESAVAKCGQSALAADTDSCSEGGSGRPVEMTAARRNDCLTAAELNCHGEDYRAAIHPKRPNTIMRDLGLENPYWQVFRDKFGFVPGLSIMDLLFNEGPESICWLLPTYDRFPRKA